MSTPAIIGIKYPTENNTVTYITVNFDGYPDHTGKMLNAFYNTTEKVQRLIMLGDLSSIGPTLDKCVFYYRDHKEEFQSVAPKFWTGDKQSLTRFVSYVYIFIVDPNDITQGQWASFKGD